ncbi:sulfatase [Vallitalea sediminicola]
MERQPNVLIILTDQQSRWTLSCYGGNEIHTPNIDSIGEEGAILTNFFTPSAVCTPSRGCFITGRYPHQNGAYTNDVPLNEDEITLAHILRNENYKTGYIGKWHLNGREYPGWMTADTSMGFDDCEHMFNCGHYKNVVEQTHGKPIFNFDIGSGRYMTDWITDKSLDFIERNKDDKFLLMVSIPDPHTPYNVREPYDKMFDPKDVTIPDTFNEEKLPDWAEDDEWGREQLFSINIKDREEKFKHYKSQYLGEVKCIDDNVGRILEYLKVKNILDDTIVIFTTDHGDYMGEHGLLYKNNLYESVYRIPFLIRWPEKIIKETKVKEYITVVDFQQTILGLMDIPPSGREQGRNASELIKGNKIPWENKVYIHPNEVPRAGIITEEYELAYVGRGFNKEPNHQYKEHILFDRINDKQQTNNLYGKKEYESIVSELTNKIINHHKKLGTNTDVLPKILRNESL